MDNPDKMVTFLNGLSGISFLTFIHYTVIYSTFMAPGVMEHLICQVFCSCWLCYHLISNNSPCFQVLVVYTRIAMGASLGGRWVAARSPQQSGGAAVRWPLGEAFMAVDLKSWHSLTLMYDSR